MSARDVDLEFEKAYQRLFSTSAPTTAGAGATGGNTAISKPRAISSEKAHTANSGSRSTKPSIHHVDSSERSRSVDAGLHALSRQPSGSSSQPQIVQQRPSHARPVQRGPPSQSRSFQSPLDALAQHKAALSSKGKARAASRAPSEGFRPLETIGRHSAAPLAVSSPSNSAPYQGSVAYYSYPPGQASYQVSGPIVGHVPSLTTVPGQAIAWTQPIMPAGAIPTMAYPGFSASVTFSQPQFFPSPPQQVHSGVTAQPAEPWQPQYTPPRSGTAIASTSTLPEASSSSSHHGCLAASPQARLADTNREMRMYNQEHIDSKAHVKRTFAMPTLTAKQIFRANHEQMRKQKQKQKPWKPLLDENGVRIPRKRGRPRLRDLSPSKAEAEVSAGPQASVRIKDESAQMQSVPGTGAMPLEGCFPLEAGRDRPGAFETHTLYVDSARRLRWLVRTAILQAKLRATGKSSMVPPEKDYSQWARWSISFGAHPQPFGNTTASADSAGPTFDPTTSQTTPQSDSADALFPRDKKRRYLALRKDLHSATRTATAQVCMRRLRRYFAKTCAAAEGMGPQEAKRYLERKHRTAKLTRYALKFVRPASLDIRTLWSVWARAAHRSNDRKVATPARSVSFAQPLKSPQSAAAPWIKPEPQSPSTHQQSSTFREPQIKQEPISEAFVAPGLPSTPVLHGDAEQGGRRAGNESARLFLRRNFRLFRLAGSVHLPLV